MLNILNGIDVLIILVELIAAIFIIIMFVRSNRDRRELKAFMETMTETNSLSEDEYEMINLYRSLSKPQQRKIVARMNKLLNPSDDLFDTDNGEEAKR